MTVVDDADQERGAEGRRLGRWVELTRAHRAQSEARNGIQEPRNQGLKHPKLLVVLTV